MGFFNKIKNIFTAEDKDEAELEAARARHGIVLNAKDKAEIDKPMSDDERWAQEYDAWEDLKHFRSTFFIGGWAAKKFHIVGEDKVKKELAALAKKREEDAKKKEWDIWEKNKENKH
jgi:hypothetical protein